MGGSVYLRRKLGLAVRNETGGTPLKMGAFAHCPTAPKRAWSGHVQFNRKELIVLGSCPSDMSCRTRCRRIRARTGPSLALRLRVWMKNLELDAALAGGANPAQNDELALRAKQLAEPKKRRELAKAITHLIAIADRHNGAAIVTPYPPFRPWQVQANRSLLLELAERLRGQRPPALQGSRDDLAVARRRHEAHLPPIAIQPRWSAQYALPCRPSMPTRAT